MQRTPLEGTRYALVAPLGAGAFGEVFVAEHEELGKRVVIKLLRRQLTARLELGERLRREARLLAQIRHPSLVDIYDLSVTADGRPFFVMEYVDGYTLRQFLQARDDRVEAHVACELLAHALDGLDVAHERGVVHRDIKPENLLVGRDGRLRVLDFGVAKLLEGADVTIGMQTAAGAILGTPRYMAPEQVEAKPVGPATDLYAVGCVLFEMIAGQPVFDGRTALELMEAHKRKEPPTLSLRTGRRVDPELEDVVAQALRKDPRRRAPSAAVMALQLRRIVSRLTGRTSRPDEKPTVQVDIDPAAIAASVRAVDPIASTTTSGLATIPRGAPDVAGAEDTAATTVRPTGSSIVEGETAARRDEETTTARFDAADEERIERTEELVADPSTLKVTDARAMAPTVRVETIDPAMHAANSQGAGGEPRASALRVTMPGTRSAGPSMLRTVAIAIGVTACVAVLALAIVVATRTSSTPASSNSSVSSESVIATTSDPSTAPATSATIVATPSAIAPSIPTVDAFVASPPSSATASAPSLVIATPTTPSTLGSPTKALPPSPSKPALPTPSTKPLSLPSSPKATASTTAPKSSPSTTAKPGTALDDRE